MPARTLTPSRARLLPGLLSMLVGVTGLAGFGVLSPSPAYASGSPGADTAVGVGQPLAATGTPELDDAAVEALRRVVTAESSYERSQEQREFFIDRVHVLRTQATAAARHAERMSARVDDSTTGMLIDAVASLVTGDETEVDLAVTAAEDEKFARRLLTIAEQGLVQAELDVAAAEKERAKARAEAAQVRTHAAAMKAARTAIERAQFHRAYDVEDRAQDRRNRRALDGWTDYLTSLGHAGIVPPHAEALTNPDHLVEPFEPVHDRNGRPVAGVAEVDTEDGTLRVLPAEAIRAVSTAFSRVGRPVATDSRSYTCGGLAAQAWQPTALGVPTGAVAQWDTLAAVPVRARQVGDLLYTAADGAEPSRVGVVVAAGLMVAADDTAESAVEQIDRKTLKDVIGARRATLPKHAGLRGEPRSSPECEEPAPVAAPVAPAAPPTLPGGWAVPVPTGYAPSTPFGVSGPLWSSGQHTGLDFAAPAGTPVYAARGGIVSIERPEWAGRLVRIDHGDGMETWYAHLSAVDVVPGQTVRAGELIGSVGSEGNSTGPHLHFEVRQDGIATDPAAALGMGGSALE